MENELEPSVAFFCGHYSEYGNAHLQSILENFDVKVVIIATDERWEIFNRQLNGDTFYQPAPLSLLRIIKETIRKILPLKIIGFLKKIVSRKKSIWDITRQKQVDLVSVFDINSDETVEALKKRNIDLILSAAYPQIFSKKILDFPLLGAINFHPSLLPLYRGAHPHYWQIVCGEKKGGLTAHFMTEKIDSGDIVAQLSFDIENCSYDELYKKIVLHTPDIVKMVKVYFLNFSSVKKPQDGSKATIFKNNREIHSRIFWNFQTSEKIYNLSRTGMAYCFFNRKRTQLSSVSISPSNRNLTNGIQVEPGTIIDITDTSIVIKTIDSCVIVQRIVDENMRNSSSFQWAKKNRIYIGEKFC